MDKELRLSVTSSCLQTQLGIAVSYVQVTQGSFSSQPWGLEASLFFWTKPKAVIAESKYVMLDADKMTLPWVPAIPTTGLPLQFQGYKGQKLISVLFSMEEFSSSF